MISKRQRTTFFPTLPSAIWWELRRKWRQTLPSLVTPRSLAVLLDMEERSARLNVYNGLLKLNLVDKEGHPTELANSWREDDLYPGVCKQIKESIYPKELLELAPGPEINRKDVERWFRLNANVGASSAGKMAGLYEILSEGDPAKKLETPKLSQGRQAQKPSSAISKAGKIPEVYSIPTENTEKKPRSIGHPEKTSFPNNGSLSEPSIHIDIQIHISPNADLTQIDHVFESMAKHLYPRRNFTDE